MAYLFNGRHRVGHCRKKYTHTLHSNRTFDTQNDINKPHFVNRIDFSKLERKSQPKKIKNKMFCEPFFFLTLFFLDCLDRLEILDKISIKNKTNLNYY